MSKPKFTPGPWQVVSEKELEIYNLEAEFICKIPAPLNSEDEHNARLIAAAPKMYALLSEWCKADPWSKMSDKACDLLIKIDGNDQ